MPSRPRFRSVLLAQLLIACVAAALLGGCGRGHDAGEKAGGELRFERLPDTTGLSHGEPLVDGFDAVRDGSGGLVVSARTRLPEGTRLRVAIVEPGRKMSAAMTQVEVHDRRFVTAPMLGEGGALPVRAWRFELRATFAPEWQSTAVLRATADGKALRGPGITRTRMGGASFFLVQELTR